MGIKKRFKIENIFRLLNIVIAHWRYDLIYMNNTNGFNFRVFDITSNKSMKGWSVLTIIYTDNFIGLEILGFYIYKKSGEPLSVGFGR